MSPGCSGSPREPREFRLGLNNLFEGLSADNLRVRFLTRASSMSDAGNDSRLGCALLFWPKQQPKDQPVCNE